MHVVQGPALVFGRGDTTPMQDWARDNYVLPALHGRASRDRHSSGPTFS
jgi:hypothetical protein